jgi:L-ascorbate metabolism protein UlaG (beta-lactamase superfamily)
MVEGLHWLGHASFKLTGARIVYIDPYQLQGGEPADLILITHGHSDHCSLEDVAKIREPQTVVVATPDCVTKLGGGVQTVRPGESLDVAGVPIETVPAYNLTKEYHPRKNGGVGYIVTLNGLRFYHAGDTDHTPEMDAVCADVALLPVDGKYTMTAAEAAAAANAMRPGLAVPMHWGRVAGGQQDADTFRDLCEVPVEILERER